MATLAALWLPILLSAMVIFIASSILHMVLPYHKNDYSKLPDEEKVTAVLRGADLKRGLYIFPYCTHQEMNKPEMVCPLPSKVPWKLPTSGDAIIPIGLKPSSTSVPVPASFQPAVSEASMSLVRTYMTSLSG